MQDPVPAIAEADASGETAAIFTDIRAVLGVGVVNLIWRHLATLPGALPWAWGGLRPLYRDGSLAAAAAALEGRLNLPPGPGLPPGGTDAAGLGPQARAGIPGVLAAYARTNPLALLALTALRRRLAGLPMAPAAPPATSLPPQPTLPLPPLPEALPPGLAALVLRLNGLGAGRADAVMATMYRHLAHWPPYLALAWVRLAPLAESGALTTAIADCRAAADALAATLPMPSLPPPPAPEAVGEALDR